MSDIKMINGKYYDFSEKNNPSFVMTAKELKNIGIKNYYFMLEIKNPRVADIDPFKKNITQQEVQALMIEYRQNLWWFMRTAVRVRTDSGIKEYCLHRGLAAVCWCFLRHQDNCITEPRQTYKTTGTIAGPIQWAFQLSSNLKAHFFGKETDNTKRNLQHLKSDIELLPEWMQFSRYADKDGKIKKARRATESLENNLLHNQLIIHPKPTSLAHAQGMARGDSGAILYFDEIEFLPFFGEILSNSAPLFKTASENASAAGKPYCRLMSTTPGNLDTREGREAMPIIKSMIPWTEKLYDMTDDEIQSYKDAFKDEYNNSDEKHSREVIDVFYIEYQYYQLRKDYNWVLEQYRLSGDKMAIRREILMQRLRGSTESPVSPEDIEYLISNMKKSTRDLLINKKWLFKLYDHGQSKINGYYKDLDENIPYLVGIDPSGGGAGDNFAITILNPLNLRIAAEFKSPYLSGPNAVRLLLELVHVHIPKAVLIPERNSMGITILQMLLETDIRDNIYWTEKQANPDDDVDMSPEDRQLKEMAKQYQKYGTYLTKKVRDVMFELLFQHVDQCKQILNTEYLVDDICKLVRTSTGKIEAAKGEHDDSLMSYLHAIYIYYHGDNLSTFGVFPSTHPIWGQITLDDENTVTEDQKTLNMINNINRGTIHENWDDYVMQDAAREENRIKELRHKFSFYRGNQDESYDETVSISTSFFDSVNGII